MGLGLCLGSGLDICWETWDDETKGRARMTAASVACGCRLNSAIETNKLGAPVVYDFKAGCPAAER